MMRLLDDGSVPITPETRGILQLSDKIARLFRGKDPATVSGTLANLTSIWLAGYVVPDDPDQTAQLRAEMLEHHLCLITELVHISARASGATLAAAKPGGRA
jgi:hypothetical protein